MTDLYDSQGLQHVAVFQQHIASSGITGQLLQAAVEWAQIHLGHSTNLFSIDYDRFGKLLPRSFIKTLWEYCWENNISMLIPTPNLGQHRAGDQFLMESFASLQHPRPLTSNELAILNRCRLHLKVHTLSDITDGSRSYITKQSLKGTRDKERPLYHDWPEQQSRNAAVEIMEENNKIWFSLTRETIEFSSRCLD